MQAKKPASLGGVPPKAKGKAAAAALGGHPPKAKGKAASTAAATAALKGVPPKAKGKAAAATALGGLGGVLPKATGKAAAAGAALGGVPPKAKGKAAAAATALEGVLPKAASKAAATAAGAALGGVPPNSKSKAAAAAAATAAATIPLPALGGADVGGQAAAAAATATQTPPAMGHRGAQSVMDSLKRLQKAGRPYPLQHYKELKGWGEKRKFAEALMVDRDASFLQVSEQKFLEQEKAQERAHGWCYLWDVARLNGMSYDPSNQSQQEFLKSLVANCDEKLADADALREQGHKMHKYSKEFETKEALKSGKQVGIGVENSIQDVVEFKKAEESLTKTFSQIFGQDADEAPTKKKTKKPVPSEVASHVLDEADPTKSSKGFLKHTIPMMSQSSLEHKVHIAMLNTKTAQDAVGYSPKLADDLKEQIGKVESIQVKLHMADLAAQSGSVDFEEVKKLKGEADTLLQDIRLPTNIFCQVKFLCTSLQHTSSSTSSNTQQV